GRSTTIASLAHQQSAALTWQRRQGRHLQDAPTGTLVRTARAPADNRVAVGSTPTACTSNGIFNNGSRTMATPAKPVRLAAATHVLNARPGPKSWTQVRGPRFVDPGSWTQVSFNQCPGRVTGAAIGQDF